MDPRMKKKLLKRINKIDKDIEKKKLKTFSIEDIKKRSEEWSKKRKKFPYNFFYWLSRVKRKIGDSFYYSKCWLFHPYNKIKIKTLAPTWCDRDYVLLHASFAIFCNVIEEEELLEHTSYDHSEEIADLEKANWEDKERQRDYIKFLKEKHEEDQKLEKELKYLYRWWTVDRPKKQEDLKDSSKKYEVGALEKAYEEDTEHLIRLIKIRGTLWT